MDIIGMRRHNVFKHFSRLLIEPELRALDVNDPDVAEIHKRIIRRKPLLWEVRSSFYREFTKVSEEVPAGLLVELGSGSGLLKMFLPSVLTSDVADYADVDPNFFRRGYPI